MIAKFSILPKTVLAVVLSLVFLFPSISHSEQSVGVIGRVIVSSGAFTAINSDGKKRTLKRRSPIYEGDTLVTSDKGRAQIRLKDGALVDLKAGTELKLEEYSFNGKEDGSERSTMNLIKGGFRSITGAIGKKNKKNYKVNTRIATIGIRGTHYGIHDCNANCTQQTASGTEQMPDGLYGGVVDGKISMKNDAGETEFGNDQYFHLAGIDAQPQVLLEPPSIVFEAGAEKKSEDTQEGSTSEGVAQEADATASPAGTTETASLEGEALPDNYSLEFTEPVDDGVSTQPLATDQNTTEIVTETMVESVGDISVTKLLGETNLTTAPPNAMFGMSFLETSPYKKFVTGMMSGSEVSIVINGSNQPTQFLIYDPQGENAQNFCNPCTFDVNTATIAEEGEDGGLGVNWGRWTGSYNITANGSQLTTASNFHFIYSENQTSDTRLFELGTQFGDVEKVYGSSGGGLSGAKVTDHLGNTSTGYAATANVNFYTRQFTLFDVDISMNGGSTWGLTLVSPTDFDVAMGGAIEMEGSCVGDYCSGTTDVGGMIEGTFVGNNAEGLMGTFGFNDGTEANDYQSTIGVTGAALLKR